MDWLSGCQLIDYRILDEGKPSDANLRLQVALTLRDSSGKEWQKTAFYVVGTAPLLTVFREMPL